MPIGVVTTGYGRPAVQALRDSIAAAKAGDALSPVTVVVPSNHVAVAVRRLLGAGAAGTVCPGREGLAGVTFLTPYRLAELFGARRLAAAGRRPVSTPVIAAALRRALGRDPGVFRPVADHAATEAALVSAFGLLADVSAEALEALAGAGRRTADVVRLCREARRILATDWYDEADLVDAAIEAVTDGDRLVDEPTQVVVHLVQDLGRGQAQLLGAVAGRWPTTVIAPLTGIPSADAGVRRSLDRLGCNLDPPAAPDVPLPVHPARTRMLTASDADEEVRAAVRAIVDAARDGTPLERIAVVFASAEPYGRLVHEHLAAAGIPRNGLALRPLAASVVGRALLDALALGDHGFRRSDVLGLLARLSPPSAANGHGAPAEWERLSRRAGVVAGREDWDRLLRRLADGLDERADDAEAAANAAETEAEAAPGQVVDDAGDHTPERYRERSQRLRRHAASARALREVVLGLVDDLIQADREPQTWQVRVDWLRRLAARVAGHDAERAAWPDEERGAAERVDAVLDRLAALDDIEPPPTLDVFRRTLALELDADLGRVGRFGNGVLVAPLSFAVGLDLDLVVVLGLAEGTLPGVVRDDPLLPDRDRRHARGELPLRHEAVGRDHRHLWAALAAASRLLLCVPRGDLRASHARVPSRWLVAAASALRGETVTADELLSLHDDWIEHVPSFAHAVTHAAFPPTEQDYRLRAGNRHAPDAVAAAGAEVIYARCSPAFTRFDGNLSGLSASGLSPDDVALTDTTVSATRLEAWAACPHAYFVRYLLGIDPVDDPERQLTITALDRGSLVHDVLERFVATVIARPPDQQPAPDDPWTADDRATIAAIAEQVCDDYEARGLTGRPVFWRRDRAQILSFVDRFLREDERHRRRTRTRPLGAELAFGRDNGDNGHDVLDAVEIALTDGRRLRFRGKIDRVDVADDGTLHVTDYKTGGARTYLGLGPDDPDQRGTSLQLAVYAQAVRPLAARPAAPVRADYWFVTDREGFARKGYMVDDAVLSRLSSTLTVIADGMEGGVFPARPDDTGLARVACRYCDPDGLGVTDLRRDWERKRDDPRVVPYAQLAEPRQDAAEAPGDNGAAA